jgi:Na+/proline symporter
MTTTTVLITTLAVLALFAFVALRGATGGGPDAVVDRDDYLAARGSQGVNALALSFFASGLGAWILFTPAETGVLGGWLGVIGYAVAAALPFVALVWLGPAIRAALPRGVTLGDWVRQRYGRTMQVIVALVSLFYMFLFVAAELTAIGGVATLLAGEGAGLWTRLGPVVAVAVVTLGYTAWGGLPASLRTDRWQAWLVLALSLVAVGAVIWVAGNPLPAVAAGAAMADRAAGLKSLIVLPIAVTAANLFHQGYWQRAWAAEDEEALAGGAWRGAGLTAVVMILFGAAGLLAAGIGRAEVPSISFFGLLADLPTWMGWLVLALAVALVASSVDTLQNAMAALVAGELGEGRVSLTWARWATVALAVPAIALALADISVLRLFLVADLWAAIAVVPVFLGLWRKATPQGAIAGVFAGVLAVVIGGWIGGEGLMDGLRALVLQETFDVGAFVGAPVGAAVGTIVVSLLGKRDLPGARPMAGGG